MKNVYFPNSWSAWKKESELYPDLTYYGYWTNFARKVAARIVLREIENRGPLILRYIEDNIQSHIEE